MTPLPTDARTNLKPPDEAEVRQIARGLIGAIAPQEGLTDLQRLVLVAVCKSMTGITVEPTRLTPLTAEEFAPTMGPRNLEFRTRIVQVMLLGELVLSPIPPDVADRVDRVAELLGVHDAMLRVGREYAHGSLGLALVDFERSGYTAAWDEGRSRPLHTRRALDQAWSMCVDDQALADRWRGLGDCAPGSLGRGVFDFYQARGFVFPGLPGSAPPYLAQHDWVHVLADYGSTVECEIEVFGLIARAIPDPRGFSLLAMVIGLFETGYVSQAAGLFQSDLGHLRRAGMADRLGDAMRRGAQCGLDLLEVDWFEVADRPIEEVRKQLNITPKSPDAVDAGSVGPWSPGGISPFQRNAGQAQAQAQGRSYDALGASVAEA